MTELSKKYDVHPNLVTKEDKLSIRQQCLLLGLCRTSLYYTPSEETPENLDISYIPMRRGYMYLFAISMDSRSRALDMFNDLVKRGLIKPRGYTLQTIEDSMRPGSFNVMA